MTVKIRHNGADVFSQAITDATVYLYDETFAVLAGDTVEFRTGAGIVADSLPAAELAETRAKARGLLAALGCAA